MAEIEIRLVPFKGATGLMASPGRLAKLKSAKSYPATAAAVQALTKQAQGVMLKAVQGKYVHWAGGAFKVNRITGALHGAILGGLRYPYQGNPLRGAIEVKHPHYVWIRDGVRPFDMKPGLLSGPRARVSASGIRYAVVPIKVDPNKRNGPVVWRVVTERSKGWIHPGTLPRRLDLYTQDVMRKTVARTLAAAMRKDLGL
jgi:hypothetical protein